MRGQGGKERERGEGRRDVPSTEIMTAVGWAPWLKRAHKIPCTTTWTETLTISNKSDTKE